ncbi:MAG: FKBP-type peptidyl-prolyl cis-trans isomerase [gamma proteobacterium symbiont of Lucinoma myriamae]|nr:FKBP-type peptidyl-prolyl cis-trans isomerase [gamma proteobacterium symbiont of Lucinoma myriamae]MCU7817488.1 FKBP-type peptidyl-prolyl cis-trans isomerase [gamma proteobacterium symbiont of Lucinoma myriamae]MCU7831332.1 FKBP-type peptidyl-prolyl cis-trans isomerase [gamma proteobacterium symbiont of Lucinoma myriamae]
MTNSTSPSNSEKKVDNESTVSIHFSLTLADGSPVDGTQDGEPMTFTMGDSSMIPALEDVILGLSVGDKQQVSLDPRDTFGFPDEENKHWMNKPEFDEEMELEEGLMIEFGTPAGDQVPGIILEVTEDKVLVDFNHPLAGHEVVFSVEVIAVK